MTFCSKELMQSLNVPTIIVKLDEMIVDPKPVIFDLCSFFDLECFPSYVEEVLGGLFTEPNPTRRGIEWEQEHIDAVEQMKRDYPEFFFGSHLVDF